MRVIKDMYLLDSKAEENKNGFKHAVYQKSLVWWVAVLKTGPSVGMFFDWNFQNLPFCLIITVKILR